ncbi:MAG: hypothetical protein RR472_03550, partial [Anaerovoracaceae bacterium]
PLTLAELTFRKGQDFIGKPMIARAMVNKGYIQETGDAFSGIFATEKLRAIKKKKISEKEAIKLILDAGGIPVLAHPALIRGLGQRETAEFYAHLDCLLGRLKKLGLKGIECYYPQHSEEEQLAFVHLAEKYHLHITTGSDYHGEGVHK